MFALRGNSPDEYIANCCIQTGRLYTSIFRHHTFEKLEDTDKNSIKPSVAGLGLITMVISAASMNETLPSFTAFMILVRRKVFDTAERIGASLLGFASTELGGRRHEHSAYNDHPRDNERKRQAH
jgi:hypothetical protein